MSDDKASAEALLTQLPLDDVKRILTQRFAQEVKTETFGRLWRTISGLGVPTVVLVVGLAWKQLENSVTSKVSEQRNVVIDDIKKQIDPQIDRIVRNFTDAAFRDQRGDALRSELIKATDAQEFKTALNSIVNATMQDAWTRESPRFRSLLLGQLSNDEAFRKSLANDVEQVLSSTGSVDRIIALALEKSLEQSPGHNVALALLAAVDQQKANEVVRALLEKSLSQPGLRGGSVCLNSSGAFPKWFSASVRLPSGLMAAR
jgi:hypothetical protein